jgi:hypothetical protein
MNPTHPDNSGQPPALPARRRRKRLLWRIASVAHALDISEKTLERLRKNGEFPLPDQVIRRMPFWLPSTVKAWAEKGGR